MEQSNIEGETLDQQDLQAQIDLISSQSVQKLQSIQENEQCEDELEIRRQRLCGEIDLLEAQLEEASILQRQEQEDSLMLQRMEAEVRYLEELVRQNEEEELNLEQKMRQVIIQSEQEGAEIKELADSTNTTLGQQELLDKLAEHVSEEKELFTQNMALIQELRELELERDCTLGEEAGIQKNIQNVGMKTQVTQLKIDVDRMLCNLNHEINRKHELLDGLQWLSQSCHRLTNSQEQLKKVTGLQKFDIKVMKIKEELHQCTVLRESYAQSEEMAEECSYQQRTENLERRKQDIQALLDDKLETILGQKVFEACQLAFQKDVEQELMRKTGKFNDGKTQTLYGIGSNFTHEQLKAMLLSVKDEQLRMHLKLFCENMQSDDQLMHQLYRNIQVILQVEKILNLEKEYQEQLIREQELTQFQTGLLGEFGHLNSELAQYECLLHDGEIIIMTLANKSVAKSVQYTTLDNEHKLHQQNYHQLKSKKDSLFSLFKFYINQSQKCFRNFKSIQHEISQGINKVVQLIPKDYSILKSQELEKTERDREEAKARLVKMANEKIKTLEKCEQVLKRIGSTGNKEVERLSNEIISIRRIIEKASDPQGQESLEEIMSQRANLESIPDLQEIQDTLLTLEESIAMQNKRKITEENKSYFDRMLEFEKGRRNAFTNQSKLSSLVTQIEQTFNELKKQCLALSNRRTHQDDIETIRKKMASLKDIQEFTRKTLHKFNQLDHQSSLDQMNGQSCKAISDSEQVQSEIEQLLLVVLESLKEQQQKGSQISLLETLFKDSLPRTQDQIGIKIIDIEQQIINIEQVIKFMSVCIDYSQKRDQVKKLCNTIDEIKHQFQVARDNADHVISLLSETNISSKVSLEEIEKLSQSGMSLQSQQKQIQESLDEINSALLKLRGKISDADISELIKIRRQDLRSIHQQIMSCDKDAVALSASGLQSQLEGIRKFLQRITLDRDNIEERLSMVRQASLASNLAVSDASELLVYMTEVSDLGTMLNQRGIDMENIVKQIKHMKSRHSGLDFSKKLESLQAKLDQAVQRINSMKMQCDDISALCDEFAGYCSDDQEEELVKRLQSSDLREFQGLLRILSEQNEDIHDKLRQVERMRDKEQSEKLDIQFQEVSHALSNHLNDVSSLEKRVARYYQVFNGAQGTQMVGQRQQEVNELERRLGQMEIIIERIQEESIREIERANGDPMKAKIIEELIDVKRDLGEMKDDIQGRLQRNLQDAIGQVKDVLSSVHIKSNFDVLKDCKMLKKLILCILKAAKQTKLRLNQLRSRYEGCKLRLRTMPKYQPLKGDDVDKMIADWIFSNSCPIPIQRVGNGFYQFGQKKIFAKITNGKLVIRVGGGYMGIDEFMYYYGAQELNKMLAYEDFDLEEIDFDKIVRSENNKKDIINQFDDGKTVIGSQQLRKRLSPRHNMKQTEESSRSPKPRSGVSPQRSGTPSVQYMSKQDFRKSSQGYHSPPRSSQSSYQRSMGQSGSNSSKSLKIKNHLTAPANTQGRKTPKQIVVSNVEEEFLGISAKGDDPYNQFLKYNSISDKQENFSTGEGFGTEIFQEYQEPKSKILDIINERKATSKALKK